MQTDLGLLPLSDREGRPDDHIYMRLERRLHEIPIAVTSGVSEFRVNTTG